MRLDMRWMALALLLPLVAQADTNVDYAYAFPLDAKAQGEAYRIVLSPDIYASASPGAGLRDMVVVNAMGRPVPFGPMPPSPPSEHHYEASARLLPVPIGAASDGDVKVERNTNGDIVISQSDRAASAQHPGAWLIDAGRAIQLDSIALDPDTLRQDFQLHLDLEGSDDLRQWRSLVDGASVTRVHGDEDQVEQLTINTPNDTVFRYYRLRLTDGDVDWSAGHAPLARLSGSFTDAAGDHASQWQWLVANRQAQTSGDYDYTLPAALPVEALRVALPAGNNAARVHVLAREGDGAWTEIANADLVRAGGKDDGRVVTLAPRSVRQLRVHSDTVLAGSPALSVAWLPAQYVFVPEGGAPYRLLVGSYAARRGEYPIDEALNRLRGSHDMDWTPPVAALGMRVDEAGAAALDAPRVPYDWTRPLLWLVLVLGALAVAGMAWSLLRQGRNTES